MKINGNNECTFPLLSSSISNWKNGGDAIISAQLTKKNVGEDGKGYFTWASGVTYEGDTVNGQRTGFGKQTWVNGSSYDGEFLNDMRHGNGRHDWSTGETYDGEFFKDHRHGFGTYTFSDGSLYRGRFYLDRKEGYGEFVFANGDTFKGLYKKDERCGPGIVTHANSNRQDVGLWYREKLLRLCSKVDGIFSMENHPEYQYYPDERFKQMLPTEDDIPGGENIYECGKIGYSSFLTDENFLPKGIENYSKDFEHLPLTANLREDLDRAFFRENFQIVKSDLNSFLIAKNNTPLLMEIQRQIYKHRHQAIQFDSFVSMVEGIPRDKFLSQKGNLEILSENLIRAAANGNGKAVYALLKSGLVNPNCCDSVGNTPLIGAALNCHKNIVNLLLDMGADIDHVNDEAVSALTACHIFYYPVDHFKPNIAERYVSEFVQNQVTPISQKPKKGRKERSASVTRRGSKVKAPDKEKESQKQDKKNNCKQMQKSNSPVFSDSDIEKIQHKVAIDCCKSDLKIKARYREITSVKSEKRKQEREESSDTGSNSFESLQLEVDTSLASKENLIDFYMDIPEDLIERTATILSMNKRAVSGVSTRDGRAMSLGTTGALAVWKAEHEELHQMIELLLQRGADPNGSSVPMPPLFFAIKAGDTEAIRLLLLKGASTETRISSMLGGFTPLHIASAISGKEGIEATRLLLHARADPNATAHDQDIPYHNINTHLESATSSEYSVPVKKTNSSSQWLHEGLNEVEEGGRTALHIACDRDDDYKNACEVVHELLNNRADPDVIWSGHSPLSLAICSGNDSAIEQLLLYNADASLPLKRGVGNALCVASNPEYEYRRTPDNRLKLVDILVKAGANMLAPVTYGAKKMTGTVVDYAHWMFNKDIRIAHTPYHALTYQERDTYNARKKLLSHLGTLLREAATKVEREKLKQECKFGIRTKVILQKMWQDEDQKDKKGKYIKYFELGDVESTEEINFQTEPQEEISRKDFVQKEIEIQHVKKVLKGRIGSGPIRKPMFRYCYECGRSVGVRLTTCSRCREVYYCSRSCKLKAWEDRHKNECLRMKTVPEMDSPSPSEVASYFTTQTLNEVISNKFTDSIKISPRNIVRNTEFLPHPDTETAPNNNYTKPKHRSQKKTRSAHSGISYPSTKSAPRRAHVGKKIRSKVGKEVVFGTTGMTLSELGIKENYSFN